jgi:hypothetical protein
MKTMKAFGTAIILSLTISISAFAGEIATPTAPRLGDTSPGISSTSPSALPAVTEIGYLENTSALSDVLMMLVSMF